MAFQGAKSYYSILHISQYTLKKMLGCFNNCLG